MRITAQNTIYYDTHSMMCDTKNSRERERGRKKERGCVAGMSRMAMVRHDNSERHVAEVDMGHENNFFYSILPITSHRVWYSTCTR
jgi:hypothetical protein